MTCIAIIVGLAITFPSAADSNESISNPASNPEATEVAVQPASNVSRPALEAIVRGLFVEMRTGLGYAAKSDRIPADPAYPQLTGSSESLGFSTFVDVAAGFDLNDALALQLVGGLNLTNGRRDDRVRALGVSYVGAGFRLAVPLDDRLQVVFSPNFAYARSDTVVEKATTGVALVASVGFNYHVHVRHFAVGADLTGLVPLTPVRAFIGIVPHIRYTF